MAKATSTKAAKNTKNSLVTNPLVVKAYSSLAKSTKAEERQFVTTLASLLSTGKTSVRIARASVKEAIKVSGQAPSFRASHVESATISALIFTLKGSDVVKNSDIFKLADRIRTAYGMEEGLTGVANFKGSYSDLDTATPTIAETRAENAEADTDKEDKPVKVESVETILADTLKRIKSLGDIRNLATSDLQQLAATMETLRVIAKNSKAA